MDQTPSQIEQFKSDLLVEQHKRFISLQKDLDECEILTGSWNPQNKFYNLYETVESVHDEIDEFNAENEETAPTASGASRVSVVPQTPGGSSGAGASRASIANKVKAFNSELTKLQQKFQNMDDVAYDQQKIQMVYQMTERALEQKDHLDVILERLNVLESINKESPNLESKMQGIVKRATVDIPQALVREQEAAQSVRTQIIEAANELDKLV